MPSELQGVSADGAISPCRSIDQSMTFLADPRQHYQSSTCLSHLRRKGNALKFGDSEPLSTNEARMAILELKEIPAKSQQLHLGVV